MLALTTAATALAAAESALPGLGTGAIYADLNTASPALKRDLAALVAGAGARFADVALLGPVPARGLGTPALASGSGAQAFAEVFGPLGMPVEVVSDRPGDAATLKLLRSVFMKGLAGIRAREPAARPKAAGHGDWLRGEIAAVIGEPLLERLVEGSRRHAARRVDEMEAARELLLELGVEPRVAAASASVLAELAAPAGRRALGCGSLTTQQAVGTSPSDRARALVQRRVRPARPRGSGRASAADRRPSRSHSASPSSGSRASPSSRTTRPPPSARRSSRRSFPEVRGRRHADPQLGGGRHERPRRRDRRARGRADRLDAHGRLARGDGGQDRAEGRGQGSAVGAAPARAARASG